MALRRQNHTLLFVYDGADNDRIVAHEQASRMSCEISTIHGRLQSLSLLRIVVEQFQTDAVWNLGKEIRTCWHRERPFHCDGLA